MSDTEKIRIKIRANYSKLLINPKLKVAVNPRKSKLFLEV